MHKPEKVELTNMCMITNGDYILVQNMMICIKMALFQCFYSIKDVKKCMKA